MIWCIYQTSTFVCQMLLTDLKQLLSHGIINFTVQNLINLWLCEWFSKCLEERKGHSLSERQSIEWTLIWLWRFNAMKAETRWRVILIEPYAWLRWVYKCNYLQLSITVYIIRRWDEVMCADRFGRISIIYGRHLVIWGSFWLPIIIINLIP